MSDLLFFKVEPATKILNRLKNFIPHPLLAAAYPIIFLYSQNIEEVSVGQVAWLLAVFLAAALLLVLLLGLFVGDRRKAAAVTTIFLIFFFSFGHVLEFLKKQGGPFKAAAGYLVFLWLGLFILAAILILKARDASALTSMFNVSLSVMLVLALYQIVTFRAENRDIWKELQKVDRQAAQSVESVPDFKGKLPDIYYIILDSYPNNATLQKIFNYDNSSFTNYLKRKGFYIAERSRSNYTLTYLSLASSLNMEYINYLRGEKVTKKNFSAVPYQMVKNNLAAKFLRKLGYKFIHIRSGWSGTAKNKYADMQIFTGGDNEFLMMVVETSLLRLAESKFGFIRADERQRRLNTFKQLAEIPYRKEPTFTFAHMVFPHPPFFFTATGRPIIKQKYSWGGAGWAQRTKYRNQLIFADKKVKETIDEILRRSKTRPIIIIQGDHGPASSFYVEGDGSWENPTDRQLNERTGILNAYLLPVKSRRALRPDISPVNTFRLIFSTYFGADYKLLPDKVYYSTYKRPYDFVDETAKTADLGY